MTKTLFSTFMGSTLLALSSIAWAGHGGPDNSYRAPVVDVDPVYDHIRVSQPREVCWNETVTRRSRNPAPAILGGIIGGVIGNQFGDGNGRRAMTVAGTALGASIGAREARRNSRHYTDVERVCEVQHEPAHRRQLVGYEVRYRIGRETFKTFMREHPGRYVHVRMGVSP